MKKIFYKNLIVSIIVLSLGQLFKNETLDINP